MVRVIQWGREVKRCPLASQWRHTTYRPVAATVVFPDSHPHRHLLTWLSIFFAYSRDHKPNQWEVSVRNEKLKLNVRQDAHGSITIALKERRRMGQRFAGRKEAIGEILNKLKVQKREGKKAQKYVSLSSTQFWRWKTKHWRQK